jgi:hypothetical protein
MELSGEGVSFKLGLMLKEKTWRCNLCQTGRFLTVSHTDRALG